MDDNLLCLRCRTSGHKASICPLWQKQDDKVGDRSGEEFFLRQFQRQQEQLCQQCERYNILNYISTAQVDDYVSKSEYVRELWGTQEYVTRPALELGSLETLSLRTDCPLCRLLFRIFPEITNESTRDTMHFLPALPSYERLRCPLKNVEGALKARYATYFAIENDESIYANTISSHSYNEAYSTLWRQVRAFALSSKNALPGRDAMNARLVNPFVTFDLIKKWLHTCEPTHGRNCQPVWVKELETSSMLDVRVRKVVPCPPRCRYIALSYVWGGVLAQPGALENGTLPRIIEDAITLAVNLGFQYLWVDSLCVDQTGSLQQAQQISIMDRIYQGATITIIAVAGEHANAGLPGVYARTPQGAETINDKDLLVLSPTVQHQEPNLKYNSRAWTLQEEALSRRRIGFTDYEASFVCNHANYYETIDDSVDPADYFIFYDDENINTWFMNPDKVRETSPPEQCMDIGLGIYRNMVKEYTHRQMTNTSDSLNAFMGLQNYLHRSLFSSGFTWGLPLHECPQSLRWFHHRKSTPKRRPQSPSWSWTGWEGEVHYSSHLNLLSDDNSELSDKSVDMRPRFVRIDDQTLTLEAHLVTIELRTEPFTEAFIPGTDTLLGRMKEPDFIHPITLPSGVYNFLVVERFHYRPHYRVLQGNNRLRCELYMLMLDPEDALFTRRTKVRLWLEPDVSLEMAKPTFGLVKLR